VRTLSPFFGTLCLCLSHPPRSPTPFPVACRRLPPCHCHSLLPTPRLPLSPLRYHLLFTLCSQSPQLLALLCHPLLAFLSLLPRSLRASPIAFTLPAHPHVTCPLSSPLSLPPGPLSYATSQHLEYLQGMLRHTLTLTP
jgi:hypothetical protein